MTNSAAQTQPAPADTTFLPGPVLLLGAPGVGKGTQAQLLMGRFRIPQISTGDILRSNIAKGTKLGKAAKDLVDAGQLVSDDLVNEMVADRLAESDTESGYILDGFPRTLNQAIWIDNHLAGAKIALPIVAVHITVSYDELLHRITGRRTCPGCKSIYNVFSNPPKLEGKCDIEGAELVQRPDDTEPVFIERMKTFEAQTAPVIEHYRSQGRFREIDGDQPVESVTGAITAALRSLRAT
ncbi:adenylate kinase [Granulicella sp. dw_53]|uniref:adenylate kinase n=1 Tax=Granulicella sp. dw_53 TaxID=2719792 RepID=UPI001BD41C6F|nr:adenylate kinase [Granulicella sp. dw_53]